MAENRVEYVIDLIAKDDKLRKQMAKLDWENLIGSAGKDFSKILANGAADAENKIRTTLSGIDWSSLLGEKEFLRLQQVVSKVITANAEKIKTLGRDGDISGIQKIIDYVSALGNAMNDIGSPLDKPSLVKSINNFIRVLDPISAKIEELAEKPEKVSAAFDRIFGENIVAESKNVAGGFTVIGNEAGKAAVKVNAALEKMERHLASIDALFDENYSIEFETDLETQFSNIDVEIEKVEDKIQNLKDEIDQMSTSDHGYASKRNSLLESYVKQAELYRKQILINRKYLASDANNESLFFGAEPEDVIHSAREAVSDIIDDAKRQLESFSKSRKTTKDGIDIPIKLPSQTELVKVINKYIDDINSSKSIHGIQVKFDNTIDDAGNVIEDKETRGYKGKETDYDANTTALVAKTENRLEKIANAIDNKQKGILKQTQQWRIDMLDQLKFKNGDFEFNFGDSLFESLQSYLNEQGNELKFVVDQDTIKEQLKMVIENSGLTIGGIGGTATIDPNAIAQAIYQGIQAAATGQPIQSADTTNNSESQKKEKENIADIINSSDKYVKTITEKTINVDRVINALRDFASASTKKGVGRQNVARWLNSKGINIDAINAGASEEDIISMLNEALMKRDKFGYAIGSTFAGALSDLKTFGITGGKQEDDVDALKSEILEMLGRMGINQEYWKESQRRYQSYESYANAAKYGRPIATLNKVRKPLYANSMKNFADGGYKRLTDDKYIGNLDASAEYIDALQNEYLAYANKEIDLNQQKAIKLKEEFTELDKKSIEAKERLDKAEEEYNRLKGIPEEQRTKKDNADIIKAKKEFDEAKNQYSWNKRDSEAKKKEYLRLVTYKDKNGDSHVGLIDQMKERRDAQQSVYEEAKSQIVSFKDSIKGLGENPSEDAIKSLEQVARNFFEQSGKMMQNLFKYYGDRDTFQGRVTLQNGRTIDISSPYDFLGFIDDEVANVDVYNDILMKRWERSKSVKKGVPQDFERPSYYVNRTKAPTNIKNERVEDQDFSPIDAPKTPGLTNSIRVIESNIEQLSDEKKKASDELIELDKVIESKEQEARRLSELVNDLTDTERSTLTKEAEKAQKTISEKKNKQTVEQQNISQLDAQIYSAERAIESLEIPVTNNDVKKRQQDLQGRIDALLSENESLSASSIYEKYNNAVEQHAAAKKAYEDYIEKITTEATNNEIEAKKASGEISKLSKEQNVSESDIVSQLIPQLRKKFDKEFRLSVREDIASLRTAETNARFILNQQGGIREEYDRTVGKISSNTTLISQLSQEKDKLTIEALQAERDAALQKQENALSELKYQKKLAEKRLERAKSAEDGNSDILSNNVVLQQREAERELNELRGRRAKLSGNIESADNSIISNQQRKEKLELQSQYNQLKEKELVLQREIDRLEDGEVKDTKQSEIDEARAKLKELESKITALGGSVNGTSQREYTESEKRSDALSKAIDIQNRLMIAKAQKRAYDNNVKEIEKLEQNVRTGGLTSNIGVKELNKLKFAASIDFKNSDYYRDIYTKERDRLNADYNDKGVEGLNAELSQLKALIENAKTTEDVAKLTSQINDIKSKIAAEEQKAPLGKFIYDQASSINDLIEQKKNAIRDQVIEKVIGKRQIDFKNIRKNAIDEYVKTDAYQQVKNKAADIRTAKQTEADQKFNQEVNEYVNSLVANEISKRNIDAEADSRAKDKNISVEDARKSIEQEIRRDVEQQYKEEIRQFTGEANKRRELSYAAAKNEEQKYRSDARQQAGQNAIDKEVAKIAQDKQSEIKKKQEAEIERFESSEEFQTMQDTALNNIRQKQKELWDALDEQMYQLVKAYIASIKPDKGKVGMTDDRFKSIFGDFIANSGYSLSGSNEVDLKQFILDKLASMKDIASGESDAGGTDKQEYIKNLPNLISSLEQSLAEAMRYGGFEYSDLANKDLIEEIINKTADVESNKTNRSNKEQDLANAISELEEAKKQNIDTKLFEDNIKSIKEEIAELDKLIDKEESEIENAKQLIELRAEEKSASKPTLSDKLSKAEERLSKSKENLENVKHEIAELEKDVRDAESKYGKDSAEAERARLNLLYKQRAQATLERKIGWDENRVSRWSNKIETMSSGTGNDSGILPSGSGGILNMMVNAMKEAVSSATPNIDVSELAKDITLRQILKLLGGDTKVLGDAELEHMKAELAELEAIGPAKSDDGGLGRREESVVKPSYELSVDGKNIKTDIVKHTNEFYKSVQESGNAIDAVKTCVSNLNDMSSKGEQNTAKYIEEQVKLQKALSLYGPQSDSLYQDKKGNNRFKYEDLYKELESKGIVGVESLVIKDTNGLEKAIVEKLGLGIKKAQEELQNNDNPKEDTSSTEQKKKDIADINAQLEQTKVIIDSVTSATAGTDKSLEAIQHQMDVLKKPKGMAAFTAFKDALLKLQGADESSRAGLLEDATKKAQEFVSIFAGYTKNEFGDISKWFGPDVVADANSLLGIMKQIFTVASEANKVMHPKKTTGSKEKPKSEQPTKKEEPKKPVDSLGGTKEKESNNNIVVTDEESFKTQLLELKNTIDGLTKEEKGTGKEEQLQNAMLQLIQAWKSNEKSGLKENANAKEIIAYLKSIGIDGIDKKSYAITGNALKAMSFNTTQTASGSTNSNKTTNTGRTPEQEARYQELKSKLAGGPPSDNDGNAPTSGLLQLISELAKERTLLQVLDALKSISKLQSGIAGANAAGDLYNQFKALLLGGSIDDHERLAYMNMETGVLSADVIGTVAEIDKQLLDKLRAEYNVSDGYDTQIHSHGKSTIPYFSDKDYDQFVSDYQDGIKKQVLLTQDSISVLDITAVKSVEEVSGLMNALKQAGTDAEAVQKALESFGAGATYKTRKFDELNANSLVKMLGVKSIESKYTSDETTSKANEAVYASDAAKTAADIIQKSTGESVLKTAERYGAELRTVTEKTNAKGVKSWTVELSNKYEKAMLDTHSDFADLKLGDKNNPAFGTWTDAQNIYNNYEKVFAKLQENIKAFKENPGDSALQKEIDKLIPELDKLEDKLLNIIKRKDQFLGDKKAVGIFNKKQINNAGKNLKDLATKMYAGGGINPGENIAFNGLSETPNGTRLLVDVLKDGSIKRYALEVDNATGQVKEFVMSENALVNAFQNVNKAMRQNEIVRANVAIGESPEEQSEFLNVGAYRSPAWASYNSALQEMQQYTAQLWDSMRNGKPVTKEQEDRLMMLSEKVIALGNDLKNTSVAFKNFWEQNKDDVTPLEIEDETPYDAMKRLAEIKAKANNSKLDILGFDGETFNYQLTDIRGNITKFSMVWNDLYGRIANFSEKSVAKLDPLVAKVDRLNEKFKDAQINGYLDPKDTGLQAFNDKLSQIDDIIKNGGSLEEIEKLRTEAIGLGDVVNKTIIANKRLYSGTKEVNKLNEQRNQIDYQFKEEDLTEEQIAEINKYKTAVDGVRSTYNEFAKDRSLYDETNQKTLRRQALQVQDLGKQLVSNLSHVKSLEDAVTRSGNYTNKQGNLINFGNISDPIAVQPKNNTEMAAAMKSYAQSVGLSNIENAKFNSTTKELTGTIRINNKAVVDLGVAYDDTTKRFYTFQKQERESLTGFPAFMRGLKSKITSITQYMMSITSITRAFGEIRQGIQYVREIDSALTELKKVTDETDESYSKFLDTASKTADKVGSTIKDIVSSTADWARLGFSLEDAANLSESTSILLNVSEFQSIDDATSALVSTMQAFGYAAKDSMHVVDVMNEIGKLLPIDNYIG